MLQYLKKILMFKDIRAEVGAEGKIQNILLSRKFWGALWVVAAFILSHFWGITVDEGTQQEITGTVIEGVSALMAVFGFVMQIISYIKTISNLATKAGGGA